MEIIRRLLFLLLLLVSAAITAQAQNQGEVRGVVGDETGASIAAATVTLDDGKGTTLTAQSDEQGRYHFKSVPPGEYTLTVSCEGFASYSAPVEVKARRTATINAKLLVMLSETVEVSEEEIGISTEPDKNLSAITLGQKELEALSDDPDELLAQLREMAGGGADASVLVDGFRDQGRLPPKDKIQQIKINSNPFAAEFAEPGFSRIEIVTKPGSDTYHGSFRFNINDESLNARNAFAPFRAPLQIRDYNANFNGPIIRNRWGFNFDIERREQDENDVISATVLDITGTPQLFSTTVLTPQRLFNFSIGTDLLVNKHQTVTVRLRRTTNDALNQGLQSSFDLPERAFNRSSQDTTLRFALTTIASERAVNEMRVELQRQRFNARALTAAPAILVFDAFNAGGNQGSLFSDNVNDELEFSNNFSYTYKQHTIKMGMRADFERLENINRANFGGTFSFGADVERDARGVPVTDGQGRVRPISSLENFRRVMMGIPGYRPSQFSISVGDPFVGFNQLELSWFAQDDWRISQQFTLSYGVRQELQTHLDDKFNIAPRVGIAWVPDKKRKSTIRVGAGIFYNRLDSGITFDTTRLDGQRQRQFVITRPDFFTQIPAQFSGAIARQPTIRIKADDLRAPYSVIATANYERQLPWKLVGSLSYTFQRGIHLLRTRNINAPTIGGGRPFPDRGPILQYESTGLSTRHELRVGLRTNMTRKVTLFGNYRLASVRSDTDGAFTTPSSSFDLSNEYGRANIDQRHQLFVGGSISVPWGVRLNPFIFLSSGRPFNITTGRDNNLDTLFSDRPAFARAGEPGAIVTPFGAFDATPEPGDEIIPRNFGEGPGQVNINMNVSKTFGFGLMQQPAIASGQISTDPNQMGGRRGGGDGGFGGRGGGGGGGFGGRGGGGGFGGGFGRDPRYRYNLTVSVNVQNIINRVNLANFNGVLFSPLFGRANRAQGARRVQFNLGFSF